MRLALQAIAVLFLPCIICDTGLANNHYETSSKYHQQDRRQWRQEVDSLYVFL